MESDTDITKLKYVLYARKSTDDPKRQSTSIEDQVAACETMAANWGIKLVRPYIREEKSAKIPGKRTQFSQLIEDLKAGKYDGIVAWHPDRLARNMKEGGEIINMLDEGDIVDLKFCTHPFTPDPSGIMLLGMAFVLSKEYSDRLSANVTRGVRRRLNEGKSGGTYKPGYVLNEDIYYEPDPDNYSIVEQAWKNRVNGLPYSEIVKRMNASGFTRTYKGDKTKASKMSVQKLTKLFRDPIYYGYLVQSGETINLLDKYKLDL